MKDQSDEVETPNPTEKYFISAIVGDLELVPRSLKAVAPAVVFLGAIYLFSFSVYNRTPVPLGVSELPSLLIALALVSLLIACVFMLFFVGPVLFLTVKRDARYWPIDFTGQDKVDWEGDKRRVVARRVSVAAFSTTGLPATLVCYAIFFVIAGTPQWKWIGAVASLTIAIFIALVGIRKFGSRLLPRGVKATWFLGFLTQVFLLFMSSIMVLLMFRDQVGSMSEIGAAIFLFFICLLLAIGTAVGTLVSIEVRERDGNRRQQFAAFVIVFGLLGLTPIGAAVSTGALRTLGAGGGETTVLILSSEIPSALCDLICDADTPSRSVPLKLLLKTGTRTVVQVEPAKGAEIVQTIELPTELVLGTIRSHKQR